MLFRSHVGRYGEHPGDAEADLGFLLGWECLVQRRIGERFRLLAPRLPAAVGGFYAQLARSEARHFEQYLDLAQEAEPQWRQRLRELAEHEARLATGPDPQLRFHSGPPPAHGPDAVA